MEYILFFSHHQSSSYLLWKHFDAVKNKRVYDLTYEYFGMSANFKYKKALSELEKDFYQNTKGKQEVKE